MKLAHLFKPYTISKRQERLLSRRPHNETLKFTLGLTLRRYTNLNYTTKHPEVDFTPAVRRAIELFVQIKDREESDPDLRAKAAAELGEILGWQEDKHIMNAVEEEKRHRGLTAEQCFNEAIQLAENNPEVLVWAGKYFRHQGNLNRSKELLEKAVTIRPQEKAHHQLGITLKQLAFQEKGSEVTRWAKNDNRNQTAYLRSNAYRENTARRNADHFNTRQGAWNIGGASEQFDGHWRATGRNANNWGTRGRDNGNRRLPCREQGNWRTQGGNHGDQHYTGRSPSNWQQQVFSPSDETVKYLQEAIEHFRKSVELAKGENCFAFYDLGHAHFLLKEYDEALKHFKKIIDIFPPGNSFSFNLATKHAGLVFEEMAKGEGNEERRKAFEEMSQFCLNLSLSNRCRQLLQKLQKCRTTRWLNQVFWISFHSLQGALHRLRENSGKEEGQLLKAMKDYNKTLPVLKEIFGYSEERAVDASALESTVQDYLTNGRYDDALLFLSLLKLTQQKHVLGTWRDDDVYVRVQVLVAKDRLLRCVGRNDVVTDFNVTVAKLMFRQAFQDVFCPADKLMAVPILEDRREGPADGDQNDECHGDNRSNEVERPRPGQDCLPRTTFPPEAAVNPGETSADVSSPELDDDVDDELKVLLLHDPRDKEAEGDTRNLQTVLQEICGLKTTLMCDEARLGAGRSSLVDVATEMELLVFIVRSAG